MLLKLYTGKIDKSGYDYNFIKTNIYNLFVKLSKNRKELVSFYKEVFEYAIKLNNEDTIRANIVSKKVELDLELNKLSTINNENNKLIWENLDKNKKEAFEDKYKSQEIIINKKEEELLKLTEELKTLLFFFNLNYDFFIIYMEDIYLDLKKDFITFLKKVNNKDKLVFILLFFLSKNNNNVIIKDVILNYNLKKDQINIILDSINEENLFILLKEHSNKITKFDNIFRILIKSNKKEELLKLKDIKNKYINYIIQHIEKNY